MLIMLLGLMIDRLKENELASNQTNCNLSHFSSKDVFVHSIHFLFCTVDLFFYTVQNHSFRGDFSLVLRNVEWLTLLAPSIEYGVFTVK